MSEQDWQYAIRPASAAEYSRWLAGYLDGGGKTTHAYQYRMPEGWKTAMIGFALPARYGAQALCIIVPRHVKVDCPELGHHRLYFMDGFRTSNPDSVPVFIDTEL